MRELLLILGILLTGRMPASPPDSTSQSVVWEYLQGEYDLGVGVRLQWKTSSEDDTRYFVLERSRDNGFRFDSLQIQPAKGGINRVSIYQNIDSFPYNDNIYRVRQVSYNQNDDYSPEFRLRVETADVQLFPNPFDTFLEVIAAGSPNAACRLIIFDFDSRLMFIHRWNTNLGIRQHISGFDLPAGHYFYKLIVGSRQYTGKLLRP